MKIGILEHAVRGCFSFTLVLMGLLVVRPAASHTLGSNGGSVTAKGANQDNVEIPLGTVLPVRLNHGFSSKNAKVGQPITGRIMQDVPLPNDGKIPAGAKVLGTIVSVQRPGTGSSARISFHFDKLEIHHRSICIVTNLRALAGFMEVQAAQTPEFSPGFGTPYSWVTTRQIGGDEVYGVGGPVTDQWSNTVGKGVYDGVLVHLRTQPGTNCRGALDPVDRLQALWVFSSDACGVYGMAGITIVHAGRTEPKGEIILAAEHRDVIVSGSSGMLLRVIG
jgi:hypothetical protein